MPMGNRCGPCDLFISYYKDHIRGLLALWQAAMPGFSAWHVQVGKAAASPVCCGRGSPVHAARTWSLLRRSPTMVVARSSAPARMSNTVTCHSPLSTSCCTRCLPRKPEPPVTRHRCFCCRVDTMLAGWLVRGRGCLLLCAALFVLASYLVEFFGRGRPGALLRVDHVTSLQNARRVVNTRGSRTGAAW